MEVLEVFRKPKFDESIVREEIHTYHPHTNAFNYNDEIEITVNQKDIFMAMHEAVIYLEGEIDITGATGTTTLTNNFGSYLFESITYELNGKEVDKVRDPAVLSTIKAYLCFKKTECVPLSTSGWNWPQGTVVTLHNNKNFSLLLPLHFYFGIFEDYKRVIYGKHTIKLVRSRNDNNCYSISTGSDKKLRISLTKVELKVKHIYPEDEIKYRLLEEINKDKSIFLYYRKWELYELPSLSKSTKEIWSVKTSTHLEKPRYVIVAFQTNRAGNVSLDKQYFDHLNIISLKAFLNSESYPYEAIRCDFEKNQFIDPFQKYCDFQKNFYGQNLSQPILDYGNFKSRCLFVIDCTKQNESIKQTTVDLKLEFESSNTFPADTRAYCLIIHDSIVEYKPISDIVRSII